MAGMEIFTRYLPSGKGFISVAISIFLGAVILSACGGFLYWLFKKRMAWNLKVEFRLPRDINETEMGEIKGTIIKEWGKGFYDARRGVVWVKRPRKKPIPLKPFDIKRYLSGSRNILTVLQVGVEDYRPVLEQSYLEVEEDKPIIKDGLIVKDKKGNPIFEKGALIKARIDTSESKSWRRAFERDAKSVYTVGAWLKEYGQHLAFGFIIVCIFIGFTLVLKQVG